MKGHQEKRGFAIFLLKPPASAPAFSVQMRTCVSEGLTLGVRAAEGTKFSVRKTPKDETNAHSVRVWVQAGEAKSKFASSPMRG